MAAPPPPKRGRAAADADYGEPTFGGEMVVDFKMKGIRELAGEAYRVLATLYATDQSANPYLRASRGVAGFMHRSGAHSWGGLQGGLLTVGFEANVRLLPHITNPQTMRQVMQDRAHEFPSCTNQMNIVASLLRTFVNMRVCGVSHFNINPDSIVMRKFADGKWMASLRDSESLSMPQWVGASARFPSLIATQYMYQHVDFLSSLRYTKALQAASADPVSNPYRGEMASDFVDGWALMCTIWEFMFGETFLVALGRRNTHDIGVAMMRPGGVARYRVDLDAHIKSMRDRYPFDKPHKFAIIKSLFDYIFNLMSQRGGVFQLNASDMCRAFMEPGIAVVIPQLVWTGTMNGMAGVQEGQQRDKLARLMRYMYNGRELELQIIINRSYTLALDEAFAHAYSPLKMKRVMGFLTVVGAFSHASSLLAQYVTTNDLGEPALSDEEKKIVWHALYAAVVVSMPHALSVLGHNKDEPIAQVYVLVCRYLGILPQWVEHLAQTDGESPTYPMWGKVMQYFVNHGDAYNHNYLGPSTLTLLTRGLWDYSEMINGSTRQYNVSPRVALRWYKPERLNFIERMTASPQLQWVLDMHRRVGAVPHHDPTDPRSYSIRVAGVVHDQYVFITHDQTEQLVVLPQTGQPASDHRPMIEPAAAAAMSLSQIFSTMSA